MGEFDGTRCEFGDCPNPVTPESRASWCAFHLRTYVFSEKTFLYQTFAESEVCNNCNVPVPAHSPIVVQALRGNPETKFILHLSCFRQITGLAGVPG